MHSALYLFGTLLLTGVDARCVKVTPSSSTSSSSTILSSSASPSSTIVPELSSTSAPELSSTIVPELSSSIVSELSSTSSSILVSYPVPTTFQSTVSSGPLTSSSLVSTPTVSATTSSSVPSSTSYPRTYPADVVDELRDSSISKLEDYLQGASAGECTLETASIRREWSDLDVNEREDYIAAVKCLQTKPSKFQEGAAPGAKSLFDDFVAVHISMTDEVHFTANFLSWHRYLVWTYEKALREECGYSGYQPYWNWDRYAKDPANSPLFNGNSSSLSGNSVNGGCVATGPFKDMEVNLGPGSSLEYNPRCLKRDLSAAWARMTTADKTNALITKQTTITRFQDTLEGATGVHGGGHFTIGGDPGGDLYASNGDPAFYLHHAMIDRVWWIWQLQDLPARLAAVGGRTGGGRAGSLDEDVHLSVLGGGVRLGDLLDTLGGKGGDFCYIYL